MVYIKYTSCVEIVLRAIIDPTQGQLSVLISEFNQNVVTLLVKAAVATNKSFFT